MKPSSYSFMILMSVLVVPTLVACQRSPDDLEQWRTAKQGMNKMKQWAQSRDEPRPVRIRAVEILVEEGEANLLKPTLEGVKDDDLRGAMVEVTVPIVDKKWNKQDMPQLTEKVKKSGGRVKRGQSESVEAKDLAFFLYPYASPEDQKKFQAILADWMSTDWQLRNQLGSTTLGQVAPRAGEAGIDGLLAWLEESDRPEIPASLIDKYGSDQVKKRAAIMLRNRAEQAHPDVSNALLDAMETLGHDELAPYFQMAITDPDSSDSLVDASMDALVAIKGQRAAAFFTDLVKKKTGLLRWVSATRVVEVLGKPGFSYVATGLPLAMDTYPGSGDSGLVENTEYFCKMYHGEMTDADISTVSGQLTRGLESSRWPAQILALQCAQTFEASDLDDVIAELTSSDQHIPGWGKTITVGDLAKETLEKISKS